MSTSNYVRPHRRPGRAPCAVEGCDQPWYCKRLCVMHYARVTARGDVGGSAREVRPDGTGSIRDGYLVLTGVAHPLATSQGKIPVHRRVLFDAIGPGEHPCHWCGQMLPWQGRPSRRVNVDHVDHDKLNNALSNLVPSCLDCNTKRRRAA